jgi:hypothetical protein
MALPRRKIFFTFFDFARCFLNSIKEREIFLLGFALNRAERRGFTSAGGQKFLPPNPLPFCPSAWALPKFFRRD